MYKIKLYGLGGQGVVTAANILSHAVSINENKYAKTVPAYGHERRGAPVFSDVMMDDNPILLNSFVYEPDIVIVFDASVMDKGIDMGKGIHENTRLVINTDRDSVLNRVKERYKFSEIYYVNATKIAVEHIGRNIPNGPMLGAAASTGIVKIDSIKESLMEFFGARGGEKNVQAAEEAFRKTGRL
ncbi:MAG: 2-oxoacid:acceptor oxidoreductase family protein [Candidatus Aminicenantes bacterium]|nr:MAG: 2-oxoacid:acceptor oxidoreductase family protein [Candidatus Aminicenantes bacterium]